MVRGSSPAQPWNQPFLQEAWSPLSRGWCLETKIGQQVHSLSLGLCHASPLRGRSWRTGRFGRAGTTLHMHLLIHLSAKTVSSHGDRQVQSSLKFHSKSPFYQCVSLSDSGKPAPVTHVCSALSTAGELCTCEAGAPPGFPPGWAPGWHWGAASLPPALGRCLPTSQPFYLLLQESGGCTRLVPSLQDPPDHSLHSASLLPRPPPHPQHGEID